MNTGIHSVARRTTSFLHLTISPPYMWGARLFKYYCLIAFSDRTSILKSLGVLFSLAYLSFPSSLPSDREDQSFSQHLTSTPLFTIEDYLVVDFAREEGNLPIPLDTVSSSNQKNQPRTPTRSDLLPARQQFSE
jgi:hypothetical protein